MSALPKLLDEREAARALDCRDMSDRKLEAVIAEILEYPLAGRLPDGVEAGLCVWWLRKRGVLPKRGEH